MDEPKSVDLSRWMDQMSDLIGSRPLKDVVIPGTHDSAMYPNLQHIDMAKCQDLDFTEQLNFGVRFFDFRCGYFTRNGAIIQDADGPVMDLALNFAKTPGYFMFGHGPGPQTRSRRAVSRTPWPR